MCTPGSQPEQDNGCTTREIQGMQLSGCLFVHHDVTSTVELDIIS